MSSLFLAMSIAFKQQLSDRGQLIGRLLLFTVIVYLFRQMFTTVGAGVERVWYYAATQAIILSGAPLVLQVAEDIRTQNIAYFLLRPVNYLCFRLSEGMGGSLYKYAVLFLYAIGYLGMLTQKLPTTMAYFCMAFCVGLASLLLFLQMSLLIGLLSFWIKDVKTVLYLNLTATFCFGGLLIPIVCYPDWMQAVCFATPYPWILWLPATLFSGGAVSLGLAPLALGSWSALFVLLNSLVFRRVRTALRRGGG